MGWGGEKKKQKRSYKTKLNASLLKQNQNTQRVEKKAVLMRERKICANLSVKTPLSNNRQTHKALMKTDEKSPLILHLMLECVQQSHKVQIQPQNKYLSGKQTLHKFTVPTPLS